MTVDELADRIAICELKARYCRLLDIKDWDAWEGLFTEDYILDTSAAEGPSPIHGPAAAVAFTRSFIEAARTAHQVHSPEIVVEGGTARGVWAMQDRVVFDDGSAITGYGHYSDTYRKRDGAWRIASVTLTRLHIDATGPA